MKQRLAITALAFACACSSYAQSPANPPSRPHLDQLDVLCLPFMAKRGTAEQLGSRARIFGYTDKLVATQFKRPDYNPVIYADASSSVKLTFATHDDGTPSKCSIRLTGVDNASLQAPLKAWAERHGMAMTQELASEGGGQGNNDAEYQSSSLRVYMEGMSTLTILTVDKPEP